MLALFRAVSAVFMLRAEGAGGHAHFPEEDIPEIIAAFEAAAEGDLRDGIPGVQELLGGLLDTHGI